jgi:hypothetical protein
VYGDFLEHFPELFRPAEFWEMLPDVNGQLIQQGEVYKWPCIVLEDSGDSIKKISPGKRSGSKLDLGLLDTSNHDMVFILAKYPVKTGMYMKHPETGEISRLVTNWDYTYPAGYSVWTLEKVMGANGVNDKDRLPIAGGVF